MAKEVSDKVVIILVIVAVIVSIAGTYLVYTQSTNIARTRQELLIRSDIKKGGGVGQVGLVVNPQPGQKKGDGGG